MSDRLIGHANKQNPKKTSQVMVEKHFKNVFITHSGRFKMIKEDLNNISSHSCKKHFITNTVF